jgi:hypothetical protein
MHVSNEHISGDAQEQVLLQVHCSNVKMARSSRRSPLWQQCLALVLLVACLITPAGKSDQVFWWTG